MLFLRRRHLKSCPHKSLTYWRCHCPIWLMGTENGQKIRISLNTTNWKLAEDKKAEYEAGTPEEIVPETTVSEACDQFLKYYQSRVGPAQYGKYKLLIRELKGAWGTKPLTTIASEELIKLDARWKVSAISKRKKLERLKTFFRFCHDAGWIQKNPARFLKPPASKPNPVLPFTDEEWEKIVWATEIYPDRPSGRREQVKAFVLLLRYSGLRIGDAISLTSDKLKDGKLMLYTAKAGTAVWLPLPEEVTGLLQHVSFSGRYFWTGNGLLKSAVADWQRSLKKLFKLAGVKGHAHMFRHMFAVSLLQAGVSLETVATLLGNTIRIAEKHYAPWVKSRQLALETEIERAWKLD